MGRLGDTLLEARLRAGLGQAEVAARAGVDQSMVSLYERGRREPTWPTFQRLVRSTSSIVELRTAPRLVEPGAMTLVALAGHLAAAGEDRTRRRLVLDFVGRYAACEPARRIALLLEPPDHTGEPVWDAVLGALAEHFAFHDAADPPDWALHPTRFLAAPWYFIDLPSVRPRALVTAPTAFRRRNIWIERSDLERV